MQTKKAVTSRNGKLINELSNKYRDLYRMNEDLAIKLAMTANIPDRLEFANVLKENENKMKFLADEIQRLGGVDFIRKMTVEKRR